MTLREQRGRGAGCRQALEKHSRHRQGRRSEAGEQSYGGEGEEETEAEEN